MPATPNSNTLHGVNYWVALGPQINIEYVDSEPCTNAPITSDLIRGAVTGVPDMGSAIWLAFVGEKLYSANFGNAAQVNDWGDGSGFIANNTSDQNSNHTYSTTGLYFASSKVSNTSPVLAGRWVRVLNRNRNGASSSASYSYPVILSEETQGNTDSGFGFKFSCGLDTLDLATSDATAFGTLYDRTLVALFTEAIVNGVPTLFMVCGGFVSEVSVTHTPGGASAEVTAYGPNYWLLQSYMREQYYIDPGVIGLVNQGASDKVLINGGDPLTQDVLGVGYVANHWLQCAPTVCAMHIIQHLQVYYSQNGNPTSIVSPAMHAPGPDGTNAYYGSLGQFLAIRAEGGFNELAGAVDPAFLSFSVTDGQVLSNIRQLLENEGWQYFDRHDLTQRFMRKPYYRVTQPDVTLQLSDLTKQLSGPPTITRGAERPVRQIVVERPPLATLSDAAYNTPTTQTVSSGNTYTIKPREPAANDRVRKATPSDSGLIAVVSAANWDNAKTANQAGYANAGKEPGNVQASNVSPTVDLSKYYTYYPATPRSYGRTIGPLRNVWTVDGNVYAKGRDKEERVRWSLSLPMGEVFGIGLGDLISVKYSSPLMGVAWTTGSKLFYVTSMSMATKPGRYFLNLEVSEVDPDVTA